MIYVVACLLLAVVVELGIIIANQNVLSDDVRDFTKLIEEGELVELPEIKH